MNTSIISFSPAGGTLKCANALAQNIGNVDQLIDLPDINPGTGSGARLFMRIAPVL